MKRVTIDKIEDGMILAKEIRGRSGNVLLNKGVVLNSFMGRRLKNWDILFVYVEGESDTPGDQCEEQVSPQEIKKILEDKFSLVMHDPVMKQVFAAVYQYRLQRSNQ